MSFSRTGFFLALATRQFHFHCKLKSEDNYGAPLYNYYGFSRMCHRVVKCWTGLDCRVSAKIHQINPFHLSVWVDMCVHTYLHPYEWVCVYVPVHLCCRHRNQEMASAVSSFTLYLLFLVGEGDRNSHWAWGPLIFLVSAPAHNAMVLGTCHHAWLFCRCWSLNQGLMLAVRSSPQSSSYSFLTQNYCYLQSYLHRLLLTIIYYKNELNLQPFEFHSLHIVLVHFLNP